MTRVSLPDQERVRLAVVGLGYVGLPLAVAFGEQRSCLGFDIDPERTAELSRGEDYTRELGPDEIERAVNLRFSSEASELAHANVYVITVPTPVDDRQSPDFGFLSEASRTVGRYLLAGDVVIYESTVYPGATEEICVPELEAGSGLSLDVDFSVGYSPERINPGDRERRLTDIVKITAASNEPARAFVDELYQSIIAAGTFAVTSIKVAEAAKVVENTQRDLNISLVNELALIFHHLDVDTLEVLKAAGTKWNFLPFRPGLVGGHCIGVDPYYLIHKAREAGYSPDVISAGRRVNDSIGEHIAEWVVRLMIDRGARSRARRCCCWGLRSRKTRRISAIPGWWMYAIICRAGERPWTSVIPWWMLMRWSKPIGSGRYPWLGIRASTRRLSWPWRMTSSGNGAPKGSGRSAGPGACCSTSGVSSPASRWTHGSSRALKRPEAVAPGARRYACRHAESKRVSPSPSGCLPGCGAWH